MQTLLAAINPLDLQRCRLATLSSALHWFIPSPDGPFNTPLWNSGGVDAGDVSSEVEAAGMVHQELYVHPTNALDRFQRTHTSPLMMARRTVMSFMLNDALQTLHREHEFCATDPAQCSAGECYVVQASFDKGDGRPLKKW